MLTEDLTHFPVSQKEADCGNTEGKQLQMRVALLEGWFSGCIP